MAEKTGNSKAVPWRRQDRGSGFPKREWFFPWIRRVGSEIFRSEMKPVLSSWRGFFPGHKGYPGKEVSVCRVALARFWPPEPPSCRRQPGRWVGIRVRFPRSGSKPAGEVSIYKESIHSAEGRGGVRDFVGEGVGVPQEVGGIRALFWPRGGTGP